MSHHEHQEHAEQAVQDGRTISVAILTVSDTRTRETDAGGDLIKRVCTDAGIRVLQRTIVPDEPQRIRVEIEKWIADPAIDVILCTGGTGIGRRDTTVEIVRELLTSELDGFGELFRVISWHQIGSSAMLSRAVGGLVCRDDDEGGDSFVFSMPGSVNAVETAMSKLIVPQLPHLIWERQRQGG